MFAQGGRQHLIGRCRRPICIARHIVSALKKSPLRKSQPPLYMNVWTTLGRLRRLGAIQGGRLASARGPSHADKPDTLCSRCLHGYSPRRRRGHADNESWRLPTPSPHGLANHASRDAKHGCKLNSDAAHPSRSSCFQASAHVPADMYPSAMPRTSRRRLASRSLVAVRPQDDRAGRTRDCDTNGRLRAQRGLARHTARRLFDAHTATGACRRLHSRSCIWLPAIPSSPLPLSRTWPRTVLAESISESNA